MGNFNRLVLIVGIFLGSFSAFAQVDRTALKERVEKALKRIDSTKIEITDKDFVISMYHQVLDRNPSPEELKLGTLLLSGHELEHPIERSHFIEQLIVLREGVDSLSWEDVQKNVGVIESLDLNRAPLKGVFPNYVAPIEKKEKKKFLPKVAHTGRFNAYYGYLHAHTEFSDGRGEAVSAYKMARDEAKLDFFAVTDHSELLHFWPWSKKYKKLKSIANAFNKDHNFTALYGFEWSHPILGHFNVINTKKYTSAIIKPTMGSLMRWLGKRDWAFGRFNHPGRINRKYWPYEFTKLKVYNKALHNVVGIEMWNKNDRIKSYLETRGSFREGLNFLENAISEGWYVGAVGGQDNHDADWGLRNDWRVGVWATQLTRDEIISAYFARRTFATEDKNAAISFRINGAEMGSRLTAGTYPGAVKFADRDGESFESIKLVKNGKTVSVQQVLNNQDFNFKVNGAVGDYFYVVATQKDGDILLSSPIWIVP
jgi:hypothetical protein